MDVFCSKSNTTLCQIDYFSQKKLKFQMTNSGQNEKIDVSKAFIFRIYNMFYLRAASKSIRRLRIFFYHFQKNVIFRLSALGRGLDWFNPRPKAEGKNENGS